MTRSYTLQSLHEGLNFTQEVQPLAGKRQGLAARPVQRSPAWRGQPPHSSDPSWAAAGGDGLLNGSRIAGLNFPLLICDEQTAPLGLVSAAACCTAVKPINNLQITPNSSTPI